MSEQITVDRADLEDVYVQMDDELAKMRMRRIFMEDIESDTEDTVKKARTEGFAAGLFMAGMMQTGAFAGEEEEGEEAPATKEEARASLQPQFDAGVISAGRTAEEDLYVDCEGVVDIQQAIEDTDIPNGWTAKESEFFSAIKFYGPEQ